MPEKKVDWKAVHKAELVNFVKDFYRASYDWRAQAYHARWDKWERNYRNIYDPNILAKKEPWQSVMFIPATVKDVEVISCALTKIGSGKRRPIAIEPREAGDELQAELNTDLLDYYREKGDYEISRYDAVKEACIFGSGFMKLFWEKKTAPRRVVKPVVEGVLSAMSKFRMPQVTGQKQEWQDVLVKNGVRYQHVHIRNIFLEPNSLNLNRLIHRDKLTYNELKLMADGGYFDKESVDALWMVHEGGNFEEDISPLKYEQNITDPKLPRPSYDKKHTVWEYNGPLPRKWIDFGMPEDTEEQKKKAEIITPGTALIASGHYFLASGESANYDGEPGFLKMDYIRAGQTYGIGVAQLIEGLQEELNEVRNQRMDNVSLLMNKMFIGIEKYVVDPKELRSKPGGFIRLKGSEIADVGKVLAEVQISDVPISAFRETAEIERQIQETDAANRVTVGSAGMTKDANQTLGGMEMLKQAAFDRFTIYAFLIGRMFDVQAARKSCEQIYLNIDEKSLAMILGEIPVEFLPGQFAPRWQLWKRLPPEELNVCYDFVPVDVFSMENRYQKSQDLSSKMQLMASILPGWNPIPGIKRLFKYSDFSSDEVADLLAGLDESQGPMPTPMGMGQGVPSVARPTKQNAGESSPMPTPGGAAPIG